PAVPRRRERTRQGRAHGVAGAQAQAAADRRVPQPFRMQGRMDARVGQSADGVRRGRGGQHRRGLHHRDGLYRLGQGQTGALLRDALSRPFRAGLRQTDPRGMAVRRPRRRIPRRGRLAQRLSQHGLSMTEISQQSDREPFIWGPWATLGWVIIALLVSGIVAIIPIIVLRPEAITDSAALLKDGLTPSISTL